MTVFTEGTVVFETVANILDSNYLELDEAGYDLAELKYIEFEGGEVRAVFDINTMQPLTLNIKPEILK